MAAEFVVLANNGGKARRRLRVIASRKDGMWWATLPLGGGPKIACEAATLEDAIEGAAEMAARLESDDPHHPAPAPRRIPRIRTFEDLKRALAVSREKNREDAGIWEAEFVIEDDESSGKENL